MATIEPKERLDKVTVLLPKDTVAKLDAMAARALMGSRGRVIQSIVDSLWDSQGDIQNVLNTVAAIQSAKTPQKPDETAAVLFLMLFPVGNVIARINKYLGVSATPQQQLPQQTQTAPNQK